MQESRTNLRLGGGKHITRILSVIPLAIITGFLSVAWPLHLKYGVVPSYSSILVDARRCVQVVN